MAKPKYRRLVRETYLQMIKNSVQSRMFRNFFVLDEKDRKKDILKDGRSSCAFFVSSVLKIFSLISNFHATVKITVRDMMESGWRRTRKLEPGNVLLWEEKEGHKHLGFYIGDKKAVSSAFFHFKKRVPIIHHFTYAKTRNGKPRRKIEQIFTHPDIK